MAKTTTNTTPESKYTIIRTDLFADQEALKTVLEDYKAGGLNVEDEIQKLIDLGYIK
jgi:hypothetical protein